MPRTRAAFATAAICLSLTGTAARADVTASQVWADWRGYLQGFGYRVSGTQSAQGPTLTVNDIVLETGAPDAATTIRFGPLVFTEIDRGRVEVVVPDAMPVTLDIAADALQPATQLTLTYAQTGTQMIVSGAAGDLRYDYSADAVGLDLAGLMIDGAPVADDLVQFSLNAEALQSTTGVRVGTVRSYDQNIRIGALRYDLFYASPNGIDALQFDTDTQSLVVTGTSVLPLDGTRGADDLTALLKAGVRINTFATAQQTETKIALTSAEGTTRIKTGVAQTALTLDVSARGASYGVQAQQVQMGARVAGLPFPLFAQMEGSRFKITAPVLKREIPQDFDLALSLTDFTMSDIIWAAFDPSAQLPRDPVNLTVDLNGKATVLLDDLDAAAMNRMATRGTSPLQLDALQINRLDVDALGATLRARGAVTLDNAKTITLPGFPAFPKPVGEVTMNLTGVSALVDRLGATGLLPPLNVAAAKIMLGVFAVPGAAPDTFTSTLTATQDGQILANGRRVK